MIRGHDSDFQKHIGYCNVDRNLEVYNYRFNDGCNANPMDLLEISGEIPGRKSRKLDEH